MEDLDKFLKGTAYMFEFELTRELFGASVSSSITCATKKEAFELVEKYRNMFYDYTENNNYEFLRLYVFKTFKGEKISIISQQLYYKEQ